MTYGPPQRFKAVDADAGEVLSNMAWDLCNDTSKAHILTQDAIYKMNPFENTPPNILFYQSTGHHDANGQEVFFGDVLMCINSDCFEFLINEIAEAKYIEDEAVIRSKNNECFIPYSKCFVVIGNRHHSSEQLQAAAEKVRTERG